MGKISPKNDFTWWLGPKGLNDIWNRVAKKSNNDNADLCWRGLNVRQFVRWLRRLGRPFESFWSNLAELLKAKTKNAFWSNEQSVSFAACSHILNKIEKLFNDILNFTLTGDWIYLMIISFVSSRCVPPTFSWIISFVSSRLHQLSTGSSILPPITSKPVSTVHWALSSLPVQLYITCKTLRIPYGHICISFEKVHFQDPREGPSQMGRHAEEQ